MPSHKSIDLPKPRSERVDIIFFSVELLRNVDKIGVAGTLRVRRTYQRLREPYVIAAELDTADFRHARAVIFY